MKKSALVFELCYFKDTWLYFMSENSQLPLRNICDYFYLQSGTIHVCLFLITRPLVHRKNKSNSLETRL